MDPNIAALFEKQPVPFQPADPEKITLVGKPPSFPLKLS